VSCRRRRRRRRFFCRPPLTLTDVPAPRRQDRQAHRGHQGDPRREEGGQAPRTRPPPHQGRSRVQGHPPLRLSARTPVIAIPSCNHRTSIIRRLHCELQVVRFRILRGCFPRPTTRTRISFDEQCTTTLTPRVHSREGMNERRIHSRSTRTLLLQSLLLVRLLVRRVVTIVVDGLGLSNVPCGRNVVLLRSCGVLEESFSRLWRSMSVRVDWRGG
jgi:hypothetical protein